MLRLSDMSPEHQAFERLIWGNRRTNHSEETATIFDTDIPDIVRVAIVYEMRAKRAKRAAENRAAKLARQARKQQREQAPEYGLNAFAKRVTTEDRIRASSFGIAL